MKRIVTALVATAAATAAVLAAPIGATAQAPLDLHHVNLKNAKVPGSTCRKSSPIQLHNGHGRGGRYGGEYLHVNAYGKPVYGDINHDGRDDALLAIDCSATGGAHPLDVKQSYVAFTGKSGQLGTLGVIVAKHRFFNTYVTALLRPTIHNQLVHQPERIYLPTDPYCCPSQRGGATWWLHNGTLRAKNAYLKINDRIVSANSVGFARLRETKQGLHDQYGSNLHSMVEAPQCRVYWHGAHQGRSFNGLIDTSTGPGIFGIYAPSRAVTREGVGKYSTMRQVRKAYAGHPIVVTNNSHGLQATVHLAHSYIAFGFDQSSSPATVAYIRIGNHGFVTASHTCAG